METNLPFSYMNILITILFILLLAQPENIVIIHLCTSIIGSIVANKYYSEWEKKENFMIIDIIFHWLPLVLSLSLVKFSNIGIRQFIFAAVYPLLYLSVVFYKDNKGWTQFKIVNPVTHISEMYPGVDTRTYILYYVILISLYLSRKRLGLPK